MAATSPYFTPTLMNISCFLLSSPLTDCLVEGNVCVDHSDLLAVVGDGHTGQQQRHHVESVHEGLAKPRPCHMYVEGVQLSKALKRLATEWLSGQQNFRKISDFGYQDTWLQCSKIWRYFDFVKKKRQISQKSTSNLWTDRCYHKKYVFVIYIWQIIRDFPCISF